MSHELIRYAAIYAFIFLMLILEMITLPAPLNIAMNIPFILVTVYYWSIYRPSIIPPAIVFAIGIIVDLVTGAPPGVGAIILVGLHWAISNQRAFLSAQNFPMIWLVFAMVLLGIVFAEWLVFGMLNLKWSPLNTAISQFLLGIVAFPFVFFMSHLANKILPKASFPLTSR